MSAPDTATRQGTARQGSEIEVNPLRAAIAPRERPARPSAVANAFTFGWRALLKIKHVPEQLFDVTLTPIIFTLMFTYLFGGAIAGDVGTYLQFLLPGILVQTVLIITVYTGFTLNTDITKGVFDRFRSLPVWRPSPVVGALPGDTVRYSLASTITLGLGFLLGFRAGGGIVGVLLGVGLLLVFAFSISWIFTSLGPVMRSPNAVMGTSMMILMPLDLRLQHLRRPVDDAVVPADLGGHQPGERPGHRSTRADGRDGEFLPGRLGAGGLGGDHRDRRARHDAPVPDADLRSVAGRAGVRGS